MLGRSRDNHEALTEVRSLASHLSDLVNAVRQIRDRLADMHDPGALSERLSKLEATIEQRLGGASAELIEAKEKLRQAKNHEQRARTHKSSAASNGASEITEEQLSALTDELRKELDGIDAPRGDPGGVRAMPNNLGPIGTDPYDRGARLDAAAFIPDEYDEL